MKRYEQEMYTRGTDKNGNPYHPVLTRVKRHCQQCCGDDNPKLCAFEDCPLYPIRLGKDTLKKPKTVVNAFGKGAVVPANAGESVENNVDNSKNVALSNSFEEEQELPLLP